jgi:hypothetical protein
MNNKDIICKIIYQNAGSQQEKIIYGPIPESTLFSLETCRPESIIVQGKSIPKDQIKQIIAFAEKKDLDP